MIKETRKITFNKSGSGSVSGKLILPAAWLRYLNITDQEREVELILEDNRIIIEKK